MTPTGASRKSSRARSTPRTSAQVLRDLGIGYIAAHSPQAKGRIERLWETLQDRLVAELRLHGLQTVAAAEAFLPTYLVDHNRRLAQPPAETTAAWQRPPRDLAERLSCRYTRRVARDNTVRLGPRLVQIPRGPHGRSYAGCRVELRECLDGRLLVDYQDTRLVGQPAPAPDFVLVPRRAATPPRLQELFRGGGPPSPPSPKSGFFGPRRARRPGPAPAPPRPAAPLAADLLAPSTRTPTVSATLTRRADIFTEQLGGHFHWTATARGGQLATDSMHRTHATRGATRSARASPGAPPPITRRTAGSRQAPSGGPA